MAHPASDNTPARMQIQKWEPPDEGWIKVNSDGAISKMGNKAGGGAVIRDNMGALREGMCHHFQEVLDPEVAEILTCKRALEVAKGINATRVHVELDARGSEQMLKKHTKELSASGPLVEEIKSLMQFYVDSKVSWVRRSANAAAHKLARVGVGDELCKVWLGAPPDFVLSILSDEIPNFVS